MRIFGGNRLHRRNLLCASPPSVLESRPSAHATCRYRQYGEGFYFPFTGRSCAHSYTLTLSTGYRPHYRNSGLAYLLSRLYGGGGPSHRLRAVCTAMPPAHSKAVAQCTASATSSARRKDTEHTVSGGVRLFSQSTRHVLAASHYVTCLGTISR